MKKATKARRSKNQAAKTDMPELVTVMMKLVERLEALEKKMDQVVSQISALPSEIKHVCQDLKRPEPSHHAQPSQRPDHGSQQNHGPRERTLYKAVCADCCKTCEVPFKPTGDRPVYCKECFTIRKAGHVPKDPAANVVVPRHLKEVKAVSGGEGKAAVVPKGKKIKKQKPRTKRKK